MPHGVWACRSTNSLCLYSRVTSFSTCLVLPSFFCHSQQNSVTNNFASHYLSKEVPCQFVWYNVMSYDSSYTTTANKWNILSSSIQQETFFIRYSTVQRARTGPGKEGWGGGHLHRMKIHPPPTFTLNKCAKVGAYYQTTMVCENMTILGDFSLICRFLLRLSVGLLWLQRMEFTYTLLIDNSIMSFFCIQVRIPRRIWTIAWH